MAGEYTRRWWSKASRRFSRCMRERARQRAAAADASPSARRPEDQGAGQDVPPRPPGFCIGCPERPIFAAMKLVRAGARRASCRRRYRLPPVRKPAAVQYRRHYDGLRPRPGVVVGLQRQGRQAADLGHGRWRLLAQRPDHQRSATPSSTSTTASSWSSTISIRRRPAGRTSCPRARTIRRARPTTSIVDAVKGIGVKWVRQIDRTYDVGQDARHAARGADHQGEGPENHRRVVRMHAQQAAPGEAAVQQGGQGRRAHGASERFGVDEDVCTGDHACIRLSGCPSLSVKHTDDPLQGRSGGGDRQQLRRLRQLRRSVGGRRALPVVLSRRHHPQSDRLGSLRRPDARRGDRLAAAAARATRIVFAD